MFCVFPPVRDFSQCALEWKFGLFGAALLLCCCEWIDYLLLVLLGLPAPGFAADFLREEHCLIVSHLMTPEAWFHFQGFQI